MCGIVGAVSTRNIVPILVQDLQRLEYRNYDSCGVAVHASNLDATRPAGLQRARSTVRVVELLEQVSTEHIDGATGIAHTRWAMHGASAVHNAHPHFNHGTGVDAHARAAGRVALVHNSVIENHEELYARLQARGYVFASQTDTEIIVHLVDSHYSGDLFDAVRATVAELHGAYAITVMYKDEPHRVVGARTGFPLILGVGKDAIGASSSREHFLTSDAMVLAGVTDQVVYLEESDLVDLQLGRYWIVGRNGNALTTGQRSVRIVRVHSGVAELGPYCHYMQKEIFEQPRAITDAPGGLAGIVPGLFDGTDQHGEPGTAVWRVFKDIDSVLILACGTSYYSGCTIKYWFEEIVGIPIQVEVASEYRYRTSVPNPRTLVITISQSGETADTLATLRHVQSLGMQHTLTIYNVATSAMVREYKLAYITHAGVKIGVASTKALTTQLAGLFPLTLALAQSKGRLSEEQEAAHLKAMRHLPAAPQAVLALEPQPVSWAEDFARMENALFLDRGLHYPIALGGAFKLKEISYIHAEAYPTGELKHGPPALVTSAMPVVTVAPNDALLEKLKSNIQEVRARTGVLHVLADGDTRIESSEGIHATRMPEHYGALDPLLHVVPLQLLAYHTACARGTNMDKPRNLVKSVTVERAVEHLVFYQQLTGRLASCCLLRDAPPVSVQTTVLSTGPL